MNSFTALVLPALATIVMTTAPLGAESASPRDALHSPSHALTQTAQPATGAAARLAGAWELVTRTVRRSDGRVVADAVLGERPLGRLFYDASGVMMLQMMRLGRQAAIGAPALLRSIRDSRLLIL